MADRAHNRRRDDSLPVDATSAGDFRLTRYFTLTSLIAFAVVAIALYLFERRQAEFFRQTQHEHGAHFAKIQDEFQKKQHDTLLAELTQVHEAGHVSLTRVLGNALWVSHIAPLVARAEAIPDAPCRALPTETGSSASATASARHSCFAALGQRIMAHPEFPALDTRVVATMRNSSVFKIKVFDLRGITVYSSEHGQVGEDKADNQGWRSAAAGIPASELTRRDKFSTFEGVVENRDLISSYIPVRDGSAGVVVGVFEIYSDVTPFLLQIRRISAEVAQRSTENLQRVEQHAIATQQKAERASLEMLAVVVILLALLYLVLSLLVRNGQRIIDTQARAQAASIRREERSHHEKMAALATMASSVAHEIGNPVATIAALAQDNAARQDAGQCHGCEPSVLLEQTHRIAMASRRIADFAASRGETLELIDVNQLVKSVCDFMSFDRRLRSTRVDLVPGQDLPACNVVPDHLTEALMGAFQVFAEDALGREHAPQRIVVTTALRDGGVLVQLTASNSPEPTAVSTSSGRPDGRLDSIMRRIASMGGTIEAGTSTITISLATTNAATTPSPA